MRRATIWTACLLLGHAICAPSGKGQVPFALQDPTTGKLVMQDLTGQRIDVSLMDYRQVFASSALCPGLIILDGAKIATGHNEASMLRKLGAPSRTVEASHQQSKEARLQYYRELMLAHPNTMHYYTLLSLQMEARSGWAKVLEWDSTPVGRMRVYLVADAERGPFRSELLHVELPHADTAAVHFVPGPHMVLERSTPKVTWNVETNTLSVVQGHSGTVK